MMWIILCTAVLIAIPLIILFATFYFIIEYESQSLTIKFGGKHILFTIYSEKKNKPKQVDNYIKVPKISFDEFKIKFMSAKDIYKNEKHEIISIFKSLTNKFDVETFDLSVTFGFGDAAVTGIANGFVWNIVNMGVAFINNYLNIQHKTNIAVSPVYTDSCFDIKTKLVFYTKFFRFISIMFMIKEVQKRNESSLNIIKKAGVYHG